MFQGRAYTKTKIAQLIDLDIETLPYENEIIEYLEVQQKLNKKIILATASNEIYANKIVSNLDVKRTFLKVVEQNQLNKQGHASENIQYSPNGCLCTPF